MSAAKDVTDRVLKGWQAHDADAVARCYSEDCVMTGPGRMELRGREGAKEFMTVWNDACPDNELEIEHEYATDTVVVQEGIFRGTHTGPLVSPDGETIPATGRRLEAGYADVIEVKDGLIVAERLYYDQVELLIQLGLMPAPEPVPAS
jgi:steroid delta-isomerase-like uncharacterized protein